MLPKKEARDRQPSSPVGIDWGNPLTHKLRFAWGGPASNFDSVQKRRPTTAMPTNVTSRGLGVQLDTTGLTIPHSGPTGGSKTLLLIGNPLNYNGAQNTFLRNGPAGGWSLSAGNLGLRFTIFGVADYDFSVSLPDNGMAVVGVTAVSGSTATLFIDGTQRAQVAIAAIGATTAANVQINLSPGGTSSIASTAMAAYWDRALSAAEHAQLAANPWQIFASMPRRVFLPGEVVTPTFVPSWAAYANQIIQPGASCGVM